MNTTIDPIQAIWLFLLIDSLAWVGMMFYDAGQPVKRVLRANSVRLFSSAAFTITTSAAFYYWVEGASQVWVLCIHALIYGIFPFYMFYRDKVDGLARIAYMASCLIFVGATIQGYVAGTAHYVPTALVLYLLVFLAFADKLGAYYQLSRYYYAPPFWHKYI